jgi:hypothetical protein
VVVLESALRFSAWMSSESKVTLVYKICPPHSPPPLRVCFSSSYDVADNKYEGVKWSIYILKYEEQSHSQDLRIVIE